MKFLALAIPLVALPLAAQSSTLRIVPPEAASAGNSQMYYVSVYDAGRMQQVIAGSAFCKATALIQEVDLRADGVAALQARSFNNLKFYAGYAATTPTTTSSTFANNRGAVTKYLDAAYTLPAQLANVRPFNIPFKLGSPMVYLAVKGDLLLEWEVPGQAQSKQEYFYDSHVTTTSTGTATPYGNAGPFSVLSKYAMSCPSPGKLVPGGSIVFQADGVPSNYGSVAFLGFSRTNHGPLTLPFDLTPLGAPSNWLNVSVDLVVPLPLSASGSAYAGSTTLPIPADNTLPGLHVFMQGVFVDTKANGFGLVFSEGLDMGIVSGTQPQQLVGSEDSAASNGYLPKGEGVVVQLVGVFS